MDRKQLVVATWNMQHNAPRWEAKWEHLIALGIDIAMVQEASAASRPLVGQAKRAYNPPKHDCGLAFASLTTRGAKLAPLGSFANGDVVAARLPDDDVLLIAVHSNRNNTESGTGEQYHDALSRCIEALEPLVSEGATLIAGDFNVDWHMPSLRHVSQTLGKLRSFGFADLQCESTCYVDSDGQCHEKHPPTYTADKSKWRGGIKRHRIDHMYGNKALRDRLLSVIVHSEDAWDLSDHRPIMISLGAPS
jgi:endonuclease/exonuclease/phosphatase (EEP) superfamily protein YafD